VKAKPDDARFRNLYAYRGSVWYEPIAIEWSVAA
jgi:hypothetical protein